MSAHGTSASDLIGYLTFNARSRRVTLVVCEQGGAPTRVLPLVPMGLFARVIRRMLLWLGVCGRAYRAITRDANDARSFHVWKTSDDGIILTDQLGENWLRSSTTPLDEARLTLKRISSHRRARSTVAVVPNPEIIKVVRRYGYGDASLN